MEENKKRTDEQQKKYNEQQARQGMKDKELPENSKESLDRKLDEADEESFPASDPVSVKITK